jgi:Tfp pilus assembly protein PilN
MSLSETELEAPAATSAASPTGNSSGWKKWLVFGTAAGIEIGDTALNAAIVRGRPDGVTLLASTAIENFRARAASEWGAEFRNFLKKHGQGHLSATVLLPRREVIVRLVSLPGVKPKDISSALAFQIDSLHPYGDENVAFAWARADAAQVLVGIMRQEVLDRYVSLFQEAAIPVAGFTFSASAIFSALRIAGNPPRDFAATYTAPNGSLEIYGESVAKPVFSAELDLPPARAAALARSELRLPGEEIRSLESVLPLPKNIAPYEPMAYAAALAPIAKWNAPYANLLPKERRTVHSRARLVPTLILAVMLLAVGAAWLTYAAVRDQRYLTQLQSEIQQNQQKALLAAALDRRIEEHRNRIKLLDDYRKRSQGDIEILAELSRILPPTVWTSNVDIVQDTIMFAGEADQAAPLLKIIDSSPLFRNSEFMMAVMGNRNGGEAFRIRTYRKAQINAAKVGK